MFLAITLIFIFLTEQNLHLTFWLLATLFSPNKQTAGLQG
jgi:hypothetical protein